MPGSPTGAMRAVDVTVAGALFLRLLHRADVLDILRGQSRGGDEQCDEWDDQSRVMPVKTTLGVNC